jgi:putative hemolysin
VNVYTWADVPFFVTLPALLIASGFFSGTETALFALTGQAQLRIVRRGGVVARAVEQLLADQRMLLITLMFGNMVANVSYFVVSSVLLLKLDPQQINPILFAVATLAPLLAIILLGEVLPKLIANTARTGWVRVCSVPMLGVHRLIGPLRLVLANLVITPLSRLIEPRHAPPQLAADELEALVELSQQRGVINRDEEQVLRGLVQLGQSKVRDVMVPRVDMHWIDINTPPAVVRELIRRTRLTKIPVCRGDLDHMEGVLYSRQFLLACAQGQLRSLSKLIRNVHYVPEIQRLDQLVTDFRRSGISMAIAVDEFGGTAGLVTLKDVLETIVGDLDMDQAPGEGTQPKAQSVRWDTWRVSGRLSVHDWAKTFGQSNVPSGVATVGGLVMALLDHAPEVGDRARIANVEMEVESMTGRRIENVLLRLITGEGGPPSEEPQP